MTDTLSDLLRESVADVKMPDLAGAAWHSGRRARRRRSAGTVAGVAAVAVAVSGVAWLAARGSDGHTATPVQRPSGQVSPSPSGQGSPRLGGARPDAVVPGIGRVWWGPTPAQEARLPHWPSVVPAHIDLSGDAPSVLDHPIDRAMAAFAVWGGSGLERLVVMTQTGALRSVDVSRLTRVAKPNGYRYWPETPAMLSPTGQYLVFPQDGHLEAFRLSTGRWRTIHTGSLPTEDLAWSDDTDILLPRHGPASEGTTYDVTTGQRDGASVDETLIHPRHGRAYPYGRQREGVGTAQTYDVSSASVPVRPGTFDMGMLLAVERYPGSGRTLHDVLSLTSPVDPSRWKQCCQVVGWLDDGSVVYESKGATSRLVAWHVGTHDLGQIATITGVNAGVESYVSSWARLWGRWGPGASSSAH